MEVKSTNRDDFRKVYDANYTLLMQVVMHIVYNQEIAEDLVQEAFERFYVKNISFPTMDEAKYWLLRVSKNLALNHIRRNKREIQLVEKVKKLPGETVNFFDSSKAVIEEEERRNVREAVNSLPENLRSVIQLKEYSGLDYKAIGKVLGISETNVKVRVHRARKKLEEILAAEDRDVY
ncbi:MAG: RNA polymerase sigma factor [Candidatus Ornithospirochaeta sp.]|nr:RNA polymerase sigma factor [Sphaerochaetaceae bacterium]MDD7161729.1 RNA polymerase sigma factor [Sphaerochaetaceae bacterium]MDY5524264.1 RNA polymerase sigma factor [Candidatus Ornithospirochaeta sp.]